MKKWTFLFLLVASSVLHAQTLDLPTLQYSLKTQLSSQAKDTFFFNLLQQIDFECQIKTISPIDQNPETIILVFKRIQGEAQYDSKTLTFDTDQQNVYSLEFESLKKLLNQPITLTLNRDMSLQLPIPEFQQMLHLASLENYFINQELLQQIVEALLIPAKGKTETMQLSLYFPFQTSIPAKINLKEGASQVTLIADAPLDLEGLYSPTIAGPFSIHLQGKLKGEARWGAKKFYVQRLNLTHVLKEKNQSTLFENPLTFEYSLQLTNLTL